MKQVVLFLCGAGRARGGAAYQQRRAAGYRGLGPVITEVCKVPEKVMEMKKPHTLTSPKPSEPVAHSRFTRES